MRAIISGGGIGGLTTAAALCQRGWAVTLFEEQPALRTIGSGIYIWENGLRILEALGAYDFATHGTFRGRAFERRDQHNNVIDTLELGPESRLMTVPRKQLLEALRLACVDAGVDIRTGVQVQSATAKGEFILADGQSVVAELAIGADGVWSRVRDTAGFVSAHSRTREGCLRTIVPLKAGDLQAADRDRYIENWNGNRRFLLTPLSDTQVYLALTCPKEDVQAASTEVDRKIWGDTFPQWRHLIARIGAEVSWGVYSIVQCDNWSLGHCVLVGDSAHAQPPNLGQGGGMAMQNGLALAVMLAETNRREDIPEILRAWENTVRPLTDHCQKWSTLYGEAAFLPDEIRSRAFRASSDDPWLGAQILKAALSEPLGTQAPSAEKYHMQKAG